MLTYKDLDAGGIAVFLDAKRIGTINGSSKGWRYHPKGTKIVGDAFPTLDACKKSLESD